MLGRNTNQESQNGLELAASIFGCFSSFSILSRKSEIGYFKDLTRNFMLTVHLGTSRIPAEDWLIKDILHQNDIHVRGPQNCTNQIGTLRWLTLISIDNLFA